MNSVTIIPQGLAARMISDSNPKEWEEKELRRFWIRSRMHWSMEINKLG